MIPDFLSQIYVLYLTVNTEQDNKDKLLAMQKNKLFIYLENRVQLIKNAYTTQTGHMRLAKLYAFLCRRYY